MHNLRETGYRRIKKIEGFHIDVRSFVCFAFAFVRFEIDVPSDQIAYFKAVGALELSPLSL